MTSKKTKLREYSLSLFATQEFIVKAINTTQAIKKLRKHLDENFENGVVEWEQMTIMGPFLLKNKLTKEQYSEKGVRIK